MLNNPDSVNPIINNNNCSDLMIRESGKLIEGFENLIKIQPGSLYYLSKINKSCIKINLKADNHWYGYSPFNHFKNDKTLSRITHIILKKNNVKVDKKCEICCIFNPQVLIMKCRHNLCITCAIQTNKCPTCRIDFTTDNLVVS